MSDSCKWLHEQFEQLPIFSFPLRLDQLPENGVYFFYEKDEIWGHGGNKPRIVRIGTTREGNFRKRIAEHYLFDESKMNFNSSKPAPRERSIFRKHIGSALLNQHGDDYLKIWEIDFTSRAKREKFGHLRNIETEMKIESEVTRILRSGFVFRFIELDRQTERLGKRGLESYLIGTVAHCNLCKPSVNWLGKYSPKPQIRESGFWLIHHLKAHGINEEHKRIIVKAIEKTKTRASEPDF